MQYIPIGLALSRTAKQTTRAFDDALTAAGGTLPMWLILQLLVTESPLLQAELARRVDVQGPTLTHHLNRLEELGLIARSRIATDRRSHMVTLKDPGRHAYDRLRQSAQTYDAALQAALTPAEMAALRSLLARLEMAARAFAGPDKTPPRSRD